MTVIEALPPLSSFLIARMTSIPYYIYINLSLVLFHIFQN